MPDIFVSYASGDRERVKPFVEHLQTQGWSVWWDGSISPGKSYEQVIDQALRDAACIIVLWSAKSVESQWVRSEADEGRKRGILVPAILDDVKLPRPFDRIQTADLTAFPGVKATAQIERMTTGISEVLSSGSRNSADQRGSSALARPAENSSALRTAIILAVVTAVLGLLVFIVQKKLIEKSPDPDTANLWVKQEELLSQMRAAKTPVADEISGFYSTARLLAAWAGRHSGDQRSNLNEAEITRFGSRLWSDACRRVEIAARTETDRDARQRLSGEAARLSQLQPLDGKPDSAELERLAKAAAALDNKKPDVAYGNNQKPSRTYEVEVILYNGATEPNFFVDNAPASPPPYSMGIAKFHLGAGGHRVRAEYPGRVCSATIVVPNESPVAANCELR